MILQYTSLLIICPYTIHLFFFFNDTAPTEIYTLSLHDALPICVPHHYSDASVNKVIINTLAGADTVLSSDAMTKPMVIHGGDEDRKSTRPNSSHSQISYAVFCLKKKKNKQTTRSLITRSYTVTR